MYNRLNEFTKVTVYPMYFDKHETDHGELMIGQDKKVIRFLCPCGCGKEIFLTTKEYSDTPGRNWTIKVEDGKVTLHPSINAWRLPCKSHYWIRENRIIWV